MYDAHQNRSDYFWFAMKSKSSICLVLVCSLSLLALPALGQTLLHTLDNLTPQQSAHFGQSLARLGDVNGDGAPDVLVGAPFENVDGRGRQGQAYIFSGATGRWLRTFDDPTPQVNAFFGHAVTGLGDVNGDGVSDLAVGANAQVVGGNNFVGQAFVFSGATGKLLHTLDNPKPEHDSEFGQSLAGLGDVNGDGVPDVAVGSNGNDAYIFSGATGTLLHTLEEPDPRAHSSFGYALASLGDVNGDGAPDLAVGAAGRDQAYIFSGATGTLLQTLDLPAGTSYALAGIGDVSGDGVPDVAVGDFRGHQVVIFSSAKGTLLHTLDDPTGLNSNSGFGEALAGLGDVNGDGVPDIGVGAPHDVVPNDFSDEAFVFSGATWKLLHHIKNPNPQSNPFPPPQQVLAGWFGLDLSGLGDVNGDGAPDFAVGAPMNIVNGTLNQGQAFVFSPLPEGGKLTTVKDTGAVNEPKLLDVGGLLDRLYGLQNLARVTDDQDEMWLNHGSGTVTATATFTQVEIPGSTQKGRKFGYFLSDDSFRPIIELRTANALDPAGLASAKLPDQERLPVVRWGIDRGDDPLSSRASDNAGEDHMVTFLITDGPSRGNYVVAWEDFDDQDFNDLVVEVSNVAPVKQTPMLSPSVEEEPLVLGAGGLLDTLYGLKNLERIPDPDDQYWTSVFDGSALAKAQYSGGGQNSLDVLRDNNQSSILTIEGQDTAVSGSGTVPDDDTTLRFKWGLNQRYNSVPFQNPDGADHMTTWRIVGGEDDGKYVIAWENRDIPAADRDFQDAVIEVSNVQPSKQVNDQVALLGTRTSYVQNDTNYPGGVFSITASFENTSGAAIANPFFGIVELSGGNQLKNSDAGPGGTILSVAAGSDGVWSPHETVDVTFEIGLQSTKPFQFFVDLFAGNPIKI